MPDSLMMLPGFFAVGLAGGFGHCAGMCGSLTIFLYRGAHSGYRSRLMVQAGRLLTYAALGASTALAGHAIATAPWLGKGKMALGILFGLIMLYWGLAIILPALPRPVHLGRRIEKFVFGALQKPGRAQWQSLRAGMLWGLIPCGFLYAMLLQSLALGLGAAQGAISLFLFGLGTLPAVWVTGWLAHKAKSANHLLWSRIGGALIASMGLWQLLRIFVPVLRWHPAL